MLSFGVQKYTLVCPRLLISLLCYQRQCGITNPYGILGCGQSNPDIFQTQNRSSNIWSIQQIKYDIWNCFVLWTASWDSEKWEFTYLFLQGCIESIQLHFLLIFYPHLLVECMWLFLKQHFGWLSNNKWLQVHSVLHCEVLTSCFFQVYSWHHKNTGDSTWVLQKEVPNWQLSRGPPVDII